MKVNFNHQLTDLYGNTVPFATEPPLMDPNNPRVQLKPAVTRPMTLGDLLCICLDNGREHPEVKAKKRTTYRLQKAMLEQPDDDTRGVEVGTMEVALFLKLVDEQQPPSVSGPVCDLLDPEGQIIKQ